MGVVLDTTIFIDLEHAGRGRTAKDARRSIWERLTVSLEPGEEAAIAAITASELLHGLHRASGKHRATREAFVETALAAVPILDFDLIAARVHARLWAELAAAGIDVGAHDRLVAATAVSVGWRVGTANVKHFEKVPGVEVLAIR